VRRQLRWDTDGLDLRDTYTVPEGWCLIRDAFVLIRFIGIDGCLTTKGPVAFDRANTSCANCEK
jgi:hypothetical protein